MEFDDVFLTNYDRWEGLDSEVAAEATEAEEVPEEEAIRQLGNHPVKSWEAEAEAVAEGAYTLRPHFEGDVQLGST